MVPLPRFAEPLGAIMVATALFGMPYDQFGIIAGQLHILQLDVSVWDATKFLEMPALEILGITRLHYPRDDLLAGIS